ncbi:alpha/beta hydrolase [Sphingopyxis sp.]|uniref:alpha/beta hydrolase n=1 Tax=Sphingopyxis sp. TaxID=1908224 RepID=UPI002DEA76F0|nr:alpha/beta hydrolase [Sphingopyxis sp.]
MPSAAHQDYVAQAKAAQESAKDAPPPTIEERRAGFEAFMASIPAVAGIDVAPTELGGVPVERVRAAGGESAFTLLLVHGGGFVLGSAATHRNLASRLASVANCEVVSVNYRLAPEASFPAPIDDVIAVYKALLAEGRLPGTISMIGDSCGGGIVLSVLGQLRALGIAMPASGVALCPWIDLEVVGASSTPGRVDDPHMSREMLQGIAGLYLGEASAVDPRANALFADLDGFPPLLIQAGTRDILYSDAVRFARKALDADVRLSFSTYDDLVHVWHLVGDALPEAKEAVDEVALYLKRIHRV